MSMVTPKIRKKPGRKKGLKVSQNDTWKYRHKLGTQWLKRIKKKPIATAPKLLKQKRQKPLQRLGLSRRKR